MNEWIKVEHESPISGQWVDIWDGERRITDVKFEEGSFYKYIEDHQGDYSHSKMLDVTHWMNIPERP